MSLRRERGEYHELENRLSKQRIQIFYAIVIISLLVIIGRLWYFQIAKGEYYAHLSEGNRMRQIRTSPSRGIIYDRHGNPLIRSRHAFTVSLVPGGIPQNSQAVMELLGEILQMSDEELKEAIDRGRGHPYESVRLVRDVDPKTVIAIEENRFLLPGVFIEVEAVREYLCGNLASHFLGYLGLISAQELNQLSDQGYRSSDLIGKSGLERLYEKELRGEPGFQVVEVDALSRPVQISGQVDPIPGSNLITTIDSELQLAAQNAMQEHLATIRQNYPEATSGAIVVIDPRTGELLAVVSEPGFDPSLFLNAKERNNYIRQLNNSSDLPLFNRVVQGQYGPGSVIKPFIAVAMLEEGVITPDTVFNATGTSKYGVRDWVIPLGLAPFGEITLTDALAVSSNHFFAEHGAQVGIDRLSVWLRNFGFGQPTGLEIAPAESAGLVPDREWKRERFSDRPSSERVWYPTDTEQISIGQGFLTTTPLQLAVAYCAIANRGIAYKPTLIRQIVGPSGEIKLENSPEVLIELDASKENLEAVIEGMQAVITHPRGTARNSFGDFPIKIAGKTGSYEIPNQPNHGLFAGFAPADDPEIVVVVIVEHGGGGGSAAAPIARKVFDAYFGLGKND